MFREAVVRHGMFDPSQTVSARLACVTDSLPEPCFDFLLTHPVADILLFHGFTV